MISASEIHELRFEKAAFGYKQEDIDEFLNKLEEEAAIAQRELDDSNNKIQVLADKVREYMRDEDALKDTVRNVFCKGSESQRQGRRNHCTGKRKSGCNDGRGNCTARCPH